MKTSLWAHFMTHHYSWQMLVWDSIKDCTTKISLAVRAKRDCVTSVLHDSCQYQEEDEGRRCGT